jgi:hypothetical protein
MRNAALIVAVCLLVAGCALIYWPAGFLAAGVLVGALVLLTD